MPSAAQRGNGGESAGRRSREATGAVHISEEQQQPPTMEAVQRPQHVALRRIGVLERLLLPHQRLQV